MSIHKISDDFVRYQNSYEDEEEVDFVDYDFINSTSNKNIVPSFNETHTDYMSELNNDNKFVGMSHFDESSRVGFGLDSVNKENFTNKFLTKQTTNLTKLTQTYNTNFSNFNQNFDFNCDTEIDKVNFDTNFNNLNEIIIKEHSFEHKDNDRDNIFENESYLKSKLFDNNKPESINYIQNNFVKNEIKNKNKSLADLNVNNKNINNVELKLSNKHFSKSIEDYDRVNFNTITKDQMIKINNNDLNYDNDDSDLDIELEAQSEQIIDFQRSVVELNKEKNNNIYNNKVNNNNNKNKDSLNIPEEDEFDLESEYLQKLQNLQNENENLKNQLNILKEKEIENIPKNNKINNEEFELEIENLKEENSKLLEELEIINSKLDRKTRESIDYKTQHDTLLFDYEVMERKFNDLKNTKSESQSDKDNINIINNMKTDLRKKEELLNTIQEENQNYKSQIENIKSEYNLHRQEMTKKAEKVTELQQKIFTLEQENIEIRSKSNGDSNNLREHKQNYDSLQINYLDLKNQYDLVNVKYQRLNDEKFSLKRDLVNYENEINSKNKYIEQLKNEILETSRNFYSKNKEKENSVDEYKYERERPIRNNHNNFENNYSNNFNDDSIINNSNTDSNSTKSSKRNSIIISKQNYNNNTRSNIFNSNETNYGVLNTYSNEDNTRNLNSTRASTNNSNDYNNSFNKKNQNNTNNKNNLNITDNKINILPSQINIVRKEKRVLEIETNLYTLQQEREKIRSDLSKMPEFPKQKAQILKKKDYEISITNFNQQINTLKVELRELNANTKDY